MLVHAFLRWWLGGWHMLFNQNIDIDSIIAVQLQLQLRELRLF